ncbi:hypothetical protein SCOR_21310 [Sulfidibacter corallicola]|uniref:Tetratricopeptide repeat-like domain-containing protein n=1 Tax=Sulfidibacter corallicola TaxID=2818388 RepID=A0A8A4TSU4_SULCO|nr:hypothetical protein [Sulfidibacter corallicola]QTD53026.1 hypothetical protein J3U87_11235 [Sulfidibacter corallicola]
MTKRKEERRELLKDDEFLNVMERGARFAHDEPKIVLGSSLGALLILALIFGFMSLRETQRDTNAASVYQVEKILSASQDDQDLETELKFDSKKAQYEAALLEVEKVISEQSGITRQQALIHKVGCLIALGRQDEVEPVYQEIIAKNNGYRFFGIKGLADFYLARNEYDKALAQYDALQKARGATFPEVDELVTIQRARCFKGKGDLSQARSLLNELVDKYKENDVNDRPPVFSTAEELLKELGEGEQAATEAT